MIYTFVLFYGLLTAWSTQNGTRSLNLLDWSFWLEWRTQKVWIWDCNLNFNSWVVFPLKQKWPTLEQALVGAIWYTLLSIQYPLQYMVFYSIRLNIAMHILHLPSYRLLGVMPQYWNICILPCEIIKKSCLWAKYKPFHLLTWKVLSRSKRWKSHLWDKGIKNDCTIKIRNIHVPYLKILIIFEYYIRRTLIKHKSYPHKKVSLCQSSS